jgi:hypothetical protein
MTRDDRFKYALFTIAFGGAAVFLWLCVPILVNSLHIIGAALASHAR